MGVDIGVCCRKRIAHRCIEHHGHGEGEVVGRLREGRGFVDVLQHDGEPPGGRGSVHIGHSHTDVPGLGLQRILEVQAVLLHVETARVPVYVEPLVGADGVLERLVCITFVRIYCVHAGHQQLVFRSIFLHVQHNRLCVEHGSLVHIHHFNGQHTQHSTHGRINGSCLHREGNHKHARRFIVHILYHLHLRCVRGSLREDQFTGR